MGQQFIKAMNDTFSNYLMFKKHTGGYPTKYKITARALHS